MKIAICDDEQYFRNVLSEELDIYFRERRIDFDVFCFSNGTDMLNSGISFDLIFLDYYMGQLNGIDVIKLMRERNNDTKVIFVSSYPDVVFESMKYRTYRFLVKPVDRAKFIEAVDSAIMEDKKDFKIIARDQYNENVAIPEKDIIYIQADNIYAIIITENDTYKYMNSLAKLIGELRSDCFFKSNRSYVVNMDHIISYTKTEITLSNSQKALLSRTRYKAFKEAYFNHIKRNTHQT